MSFDFDKIRDNSLQGPRVTSLLHHFESIAAGNKQIPKVLVQASPDFLQGHSERKAYHDAFQRNMGTFYQHLCSSVPFLLEQHCRVGLALIALARSQSATVTKPFALYETSSADGTNARTIAELAKGKIRSLTDSPNVANAVNFRRICTHEHSDIHTGPFVDITPDYLTSHYDGWFAGGFDAIYENTTFQMYGPNRLEQIAYVRRVLKKDGLMIFFEKVSNADATEYMRRERIKDDRFKSTYFTTADINAKKSEILAEMERGQVSLSELTDAILYHFSHAWMIWNSTNFYEIVASNDADVLLAFLGFLQEPYVPVPFCCEPNMVSELRGRGSVDSAHTS